MVEKSKVLTGDTIKPGDVIMGIESSGLHSNGFSLVRRIVKARRWKLDKHVAEFGRTLGAELLEPTRIYAQPVVAALDSKRRLIEALANITGGGMLENIPRILPNNCEAVIDTSSWEVPPVFQVLQKGGNVARNEMHHVFNMGIGMVAICRGKNVDALAGQLQGPRTKGQPKLKTHIIGHIRQGKRRVVLD